MVKYQVLNRSYLGMPLIYLNNVHATLFPKNAKVAQIVLFIRILFFFSESSAVSVSQDPMLKKCNTAKVIIPYILISTKLSLPAVKN